MPVRIFISTVSDEFRDYRDQLRKDLTRHNVEVKVEEDFKDYGGATLDNLDTYVSICDAVVHLVGDMTGSFALPPSTAAIVAKYPDLLARLPPLGKALDEGVFIPYTQWEAWLALYHGKVLLIAKADDQAARGPKYFPTDASRETQKAHLARLRDFERFPNVHFNSPDNLAKQIAYTAILDLLVRDKRARSSPGSQTFPYAGVVAALFLLFVTPLVSENLMTSWRSELAAPISILAVIGALALALLYWRYFGILTAGDEPPGSLERQAYDNLRTNLASGGLPAELYSRWLVTFLDSTDRFLGDVGIEDHSSFRKVLGLRAKVPLWTAPALDRCLLFALIYPMSVIILIWAASGHIGPVEAALGLEPDVPAWERGLALVLTGLAALLMTRMPKFSAFRFGIGGAGVSFRISFLCFAIVVLATAGAAVGAGCIAATFILFLTIVSSIPGTLAILGATAATTGIMSQLSNADMGHQHQGTAGDAATIYTGIVTFVFIFFAEWWSSATTRRQSVFLAIFFPIMVTMCLVLAWYLSSHPGWEYSGPFLLFISFLTLLNAPFDWLSLGLTRGLLRRGIELGSWWPYLLALLDALLAGLIIALLALTMIIGVQVFDAIAVFGGGKPIIPLLTLLEGIASNPNAPEYWWIYVLLLSTMLPSLINLVIAGTALMRTAPGVPRLLLSSIPLGRSVPFFDRSWVALVLTLQAAAGIILAIAAQVFLVVGLIHYVMPWLGLGLLDLAHAVVIFDFPARVGTFFS